MQLEQAGAVVRKFVGQNRSTVDPKGRFVVGRKVVAQIFANWGADPDLVLGVMGGDLCLTLCSKGEWFARRAYLENLPWFSSDNARVRRLNALVEPVEMDPQNRITFPAMLRQLAGIRDEVVLVGCGDYVELWNPETWHEAQAQLLADVDALQRAGELRSRDLALGTRSENNGTTSENM